VILIKAVKRPSTPRGSDEQPDTRTPSGKRLPF
jgi:hypothetical protein